MRKIRKLAKDTLCRVSPELLSKYQFWKMFGRKLDLENPCGLNAKIMWLKFKMYQDNPLITLCADKYAVRAYVAACNCSDTLNDLYGVWKRVEGIEWGKLPSSFVLKCNHGCGYNWLCPDKSTADPSEAFNKLRQWIQEDFWLKFAELQYRDIPKRIICEKYLGDHLVDYKFYCFNGKPMYVLTCVGRNGGEPSHVAEHEDPKFFFFDRKWKMCPFTKDSLNCPIDLRIQRPNNLEQMWEIAEKLCAPFPFVRVDLYDVNGHVVFGELTFTPSAGMDAERLPETDRIFGELLSFDQKAIDTEGKILQRCADAKINIPLINIDI